MQVSKGFFISGIFFFTLFLSVTQGYSYTIDASGGPGGTILPSGAVQVAAGADQTFAITPDPGYDILDVVTNSGSVGQVGSYTFFNVAADDSITASFDVCANPFPVLLEDNDALYNTIMEAYTGAVNDFSQDNFTLLLAGTWFEEDLYFNEGVSVFIEGGFDCSFQTSYTVTRIIGSLTIGAGTVTPSNIILSATPCVPTGDEICDGLDNNCNGIADDGLTFDDDGDGSTSFGSCEGSADDCDDNDPANFPGNPEVCDSQDNDCDGQVDEGLTDVDSDGDGYSAISSCGGSADDCNDSDPNINPGATEIYGDGIDQDCDGQDLIFSSEIECFDCHSAVYTDTVHTYVASPEPSCGDCHSERESSVRSGHYGQIVRTAGNNMTAGSIIRCTSCHDWHDEEEEYVIQGDYYVWAKVHADGRGNVTCYTCHENLTSDHETGNAHDNRLIDSLCGQCHTSDTSVLGSPGAGTLTSDEDVYALHRSDCVLCHAYTGTKLDVAIVEQAIYDGLYGAQISCLDCHSDKTTGHGSVDHVALGYVTGGTTLCMNCHDPGSGVNATVAVTHNGNCSLCHTTVPGLWPHVPAGGGDCVTCHGDYFPNHSHHSGNNNDVSYNATVDTSQASELGCAICHHDYDSVNGTSLGLGTWETILVEHDLDGTKDGSANTCDNCHGYDGSSSAPLAEVQNAIASGNPATCATCHTDKVPDVDHGVPASGKHAEHLTLPGVSCSTCHGNIPYFKSGTDSNGDGLFNLAETDVCDSCHQDATGNPATGFKAGWTDSGFALDCSGCHASAPSTGSHTTHVSLAGCWTCHDSTVAGTTAPVQHLDGNIDVYDIVPADLGYPPDKAIGSTYDSCSSSYCHSTVQGVTDPTAPPTYVASPVWGTVFGGTVATCTGCHDSGGHVGDAGTPLTTGSHGKHLNFRFDQDATCNACHFDWSYTGCVTCHQRQVNHVDNSIDVVFKPTFPQGAASSSGTYTGDPAPRTPYGTCSALYCHSPGTKASAPYDDPNETNISWGGSSMPADCTGCHDGDSAAAQAMATGSHGAHIANYDCSKCHARTVDNSRTLNSTTYATKNYTYGQRYHVDGWVTVAFSSDIATSGAYAGQASPTTYRAPGSAPGSCANTYCHSDGSSVATAVIPDNTSPDWGNAPLSCDGCHAYGPDYPNGTPKANSHAAHGSYSCDACHYSTTTTGDTITGAANHANQAYDLQAGSGVSFNYTFDINGGTCSNISCHGGNSAVWGTPLANGCASCHGTPPDYPNGSPKINSHSKHNQYNYSCAECHYATTNDGLSITDRSLHVNGEMNVTFSDPSITYDPVSHTCSNTYCHSNGITVEGRTAESSSPPPALNLPRTIMPNTSAPWGSASLSCTSCHTSENSPQTDGPDYPDADPAYQYKSNGHQDHGFLSCDYCHYATTTDGTSITNNAKHVNGTYDVVGHPTEVPQLNYAYDAGGGTCSIQCHTPPFNYHAPAAKYYWGFNTLNTRSAPSNVGCYEVKIDPDTYSTWGDGISGPFTYYLEYYDSAAQGDDWDQPHLLLGTAEGTEPFYYTYPGPPAPGAYGYPLMIWSRDANNHRSANRHVQWAHPEATPNQDPVPDFEIQVNGNTVILLDKSTDPDYNYCGNGENGYQGTIRIDWKDFTSGYEDTIVELTDQPTNVEITHTYSKTGSLRLLLYVQDNDGSWWISKWSDYFTIPGN